MVKIIAETLACLPKEIIERYQIPIVSQNIIFGNESFRENIDMNADQFMEKLFNSVAFPTTAAPSPADYIKLFEKYVPQNEPVLCICPTEKMNGTVAAATLASKEFPSADIRVIDTKLIATSLGTVVEKACIWAEEDKSIDEIELLIHQFCARNKTYFYVETLDYLARDGRIGSGNALLGGLLQMKPILTINNGRMEAHDKIRTHKKAIEQFKDLILEDYPRGEEGFLTLMHADVEEEAKKIKAELEEKLGIKNVYLTNVPPAIITRAGPGIFAAGFFTAK